MSHLRIKINKRARLAQNHDKRCITCKSSIETMLYCRQPKITRSNIQTMEIDITKTNNRGTSLLYTLLDEQVFRHLGGELLLSWPTEVVDSL